MDTNYRRAKMTLNWIVSVVEPHLPDSVVFKIYASLLTELNQHESMTTLLDSNPNRKKYAEEMLMTTSHITERKPRLHALGHALMKICPRFIKEETRDPSVSVEEHTLQVFRQNIHVLPEDADAIQGGYLSMFLI